MTRIDPDDPKWTAYVLGELDDAERAAVEVELNGSEDARLLVEELQVAASMMTAELREAVAVEPLTPQQRQMILSSVISVRPNRWFNRRPVVWISGLATASIAAIALILTVGPGAPRTENAPSALSQTMAAKATPRESSGPAEMNDSRKAVAEVELAEKRGAIDLESTPKKKQESAVQVPSLADALQVRPSSPPVNTAVANGAVATDAIATIPAEEQNQKTQRGQASEVQPEITDSLPPQSLDLPAAPATRNEREAARANLGKSAEVAAGAAVIPPRRFVAQPFSSLSGNVDTSSYSNVRGYLNRNRLPPLNAVRIDEMLNHFTYDYAQPVGGNPIGASIEAAPAPWNAQHRLVRIGIQARSAPTQREASIVANNVTVDVEFNPAEVNAYRVIGYDTGLTQTKPLKDHITTGWNMSAGQTVTILYEIVPSTKGVTGPLTVRVGYLEVSNKSEKSLVFPFVDDGKTFAASSTDFRFAAAVASFGMLLSESPDKGTATIDSVRVIAENSLGPDRDGARREFLELIQRAGQIRQQKN